MIAKVLLCSLIGLAAAQLRPQDDGDDGSYNPEKYEVPYINEVSSGPSQQYQSQPQQYQPQAPRYQPQPAAYRPPQPAYQPQPAAYRPAQPAYSRPTTDYRNAAILSETRHQSGDGSFGSAYSQDDGVEFKEESLPDGSRRGSYSYVDPTGERRTVSYTAGKNGFQAEGAHLPVAPVPAGPQYQPAPQPAYRAQQYSAPQPAYRAQQYSAPQPQYSAPAPQQYRAQPAAAPAAPAGGYTITSNY